MGEPRRGRAAQKPAAADDTKPTETRKAMPEFLDERGKFKPGNKAGGRPKGSRNKIGADFLAMLQDWCGKNAPGEAAKSNLEHLIERVAKSKPEVVLNGIIKLMPQEIDLTATIREEDLTDDQLDARELELKRKLATLGAAGLLGDEESLH